MLPLVCFLGFAFLAVSRNQQGFRVSRSGLWGAALASYSAYVVPGLFLWLGSATYSGGGANFGLAFLAIVMPGALPILMFIGLVIGEAFGFRMTGRRDR